MPTTAEYLMQYNHHPLHDTAKACIDRSESTALYVGGGKPHFPVPAIECRVVLFPEGNPFSGQPGVPYININRYNGRSNAWSIGYETVRRIWVYVR